VTSAPALRLERPGSPAEFERIAGPFLAAREPENNLALGLTSALKAGRSYGPAVYFGAVRDGDRIVGAAMRAGLYLIVTAGTTDAALRMLIDDAVRETGDAPGIVGPKDLAHRAVELWTARTGQRAQVQMAERIYALARVIAPRAVNGHMRAAGSNELDLVARWFLAFVKEAQPHLAGTAEEARANAERWIAGGGLRLWEDDEIVSMAGAHGPTPNGIRVGAVYTPPDKRRRGYASALVAALSQEQLDSGKKFCFLYTDLANPTSNKIYQDIGYEPVSDVDEYVFG
jgi:predicted GNAT family acetyltransferase